MRRHMGYEVAPRQESRENAVLSPQSARLALMVHDPLTI